MTEGERRARFDDVIRIAEYTVNTSIIENMDFANCKIIGPAVLVPLGNTGFSHCSFPVSLDAFFWEIPAGRNHVVGAVGVLSCTFSSCKFEEIGIAGSGDLRKTFERELRKQ